MTDFRFNPFTFKFRPVNKTGEIKTAQFFPAFNRVGFFLSETPIRVQGVPIAIVCGGDTLAEVSSTATPEENNFRVSYGNLTTGANVGFVEIHASRVGQVATIIYRAIGVNLNASHRADARNTYNRAVHFKKNLTVRGVTIGIVSGVNTISAGGVKITNAADAVDAADAVPLGQLNTLSDFYVNDLRDRVAALYS